MECTPTSSILLLPLSSFIDMVSQISPWSIFMIYFLLKSVRQANMYIIDSLESRESGVFGWEVRLKVRWVRLLCQSLTTPFPLTQSLFCLLVDWFQSLNLKTGWLGVNNEIFAIPGLAGAQRWSQLRRAKPRGFAHPSPTFSQWWKEMMMPYTHTDCFLD